MICSHRITVSSLPSQGKNTGSIPVGSTIKLPISLKVEYVALNHRINVRVIYGQPCLYVGIGIHRWFKISGPKGIGSSNLSTSTLTLSGDEIGSHIRLWLVTLWVRLSPRQPCSCDGNGRRSGLKIRCLKRRAGSSPVGSTTSLKSRHQNS